jgi:hypothetical protein
MKCPVSIDSFAAIKLRAVLACLETRQKNSILLFYKLGSKHGYEPLHCMRRWLENTAKPSPPVLPNLASSAFRTPFLANMANYHTGLQAENRFSAVPIAPRQFSATAHCVLAMNSLLGQRYL